MKRIVSGWSILTNVSIGLLLLPIIAIGFQLLNGAPSENWAHIQEYMLQKYMLNTVVLVVCTGLITGLLGLSLAWIVTAFDFPFRRALSWGLMLPLAIPAYIGAYTYQGLINYTGVLQTFLRNTWGLQVNQKFFNLMHLPGAIFIFSLFLYPYVFTVVRSFLTKYSGTLIESGRMLGHRPAKLFWTIILPLSSASVVGGVSLVIMEVLGDYGVVKYFGVPVFSTAIFKAWFSMGDIQAAIRLAVLLMVFVFTSLAAEKALRGRKQTAMATSKYREAKPIVLTGWKKIAAVAYAGGVFAVAFIIPVMQLVHWTYLSRDRWFTIGLLKLVQNTGVVALAATIIILVVALIVANHNRLSSGKVAKLYSSVVSLGYSIPGAVISVGVITLFVGLDRWLKPLYVSMGFSKTLILSTSIAMLIFAYALRFLAIGFNSISSGFAKNGIRYHEASRLLGKGSYRTFFLVDLPMIRPAMLGAIVLVGIDMLKELPLTLILRPFNFDTLATKAFEYANDEMIHEAAIPSLLIIVLSILMISALQYYQKRKKENRHGYVHSKY